jgi:hypothetical protein
MGKVKSQTLIIIISLLLSCSEIDQDIQVIKFDQFFKIDKELQFDQYGFTLNGFISSAWSNSTDIIFSSLEHSSILKMNINSNNIKRLGQYGRAKDQYLAPNYFTIKDSVLIFNDINDPYLRYMDLNGKYIKTDSSLAIYPFYFTFFKDDLYFLNQSKKEHYLYKNNFENAFVKKENSFKGGSSPQFTLQSLSTDNENLYFMNPYETKVYKFNPQSLSYSTYFLKIRKDKKLFQYDKTYDRKELAAIVKSSAIHLLKYFRFKNQDILLFKERKEYFLFVQDANNHRNLIPLGDKILLCIENNSFLFQKGQSGFLIASIQEIIRNH